jgi:hypothetical protein
MINQYIPISIQLFYFLFQGKWMDDHSTHHWSEGLAPVIHAINTRTTHTTKKSPYQLVFGQQPRTNIHYWKSLHDAALTNDIQMDDLIIDKLNPIDAQITPQQTNSSLQSKDLLNESGYRKFIS